MKLKIAKAAFLIFCITAFIFLLLPFLQTTPPPTPAQLKAQPQISTDNPLTAIAKRLAHLFRPRGEQKTRFVSAPVGAGSPLPQSSAQPYFLARNQMQPADRSSSAQFPAATLIPLPAPQETAYGDAAVQTDNGQWVLVRQTAPEAGQPGMHEVNVHDNPYDRYVKQERAARVAAQEVKPAIPDSKWARLVRPVKKWLGLDTPSAVGPSPVHVAREGDTLRSLTATPRTTTSIKQPSLGPVRLPLPDITPQVWAQMTPYERERYQVAQFAELISGTRGLNEAAEILADATYPNPKSEEEVREKEGYKNGLSEQGKEQIKQGILQTMQENANGKQPVDELAYMVGCKSTSLPDTSGACHNSPNGEPLPTPATSQEVINREQTQNADEFYQTTQYVLPKGLPLTPVLGPTTPETIANMSGPSQNVQDAAEIYQFLYEKQNCATQTCYWVANSKQADPQLRDAIAMANATLKPDPQNTYSSYKQAFVAYKLKQLGENATKEQLAQARKAAARQFEQSAVHYVPYTVSQAQQTQQQTLQAANPANPQGRAEDLTVFYVTDPAQAQQFAQDIQSVIFAYGKEPLTQADSAVDAGRLITQSMAQNVNDAKQVIQDVQRPLYQQTVRENVRQQLNEQTRQQNQTGAGWEGVFDKMKQSGNRSQTKGAKK